MILSGGTQPAVGGIVLNVIAILALVIAVTFVLVVFGMFIGELISYARRHA